MKFIKCPNCNYENCDDAYVCIECGHPFSEDGEGLHLNAIRVTPYNRDVLPLEDGDANKYCILDVDFTLNNNELEIDIVIAKAYETEDCNGRGDELRFSFLDTRNNDTAEQYVTLDYVPLNQPVTVSMTAKIDRDGDYSVLGYVLD